MARRALLFDVLAARGATSRDPLHEPEPSQRSLPESVRRELALLFNSTALELAEPSAQLLNVGRSTLSYGLPALAGRAASSLDQRWLAVQLAQAIRQFEPRLQPESVRVRPQTERAACHNVLSFEIDANVQHSLGAESIALDSELDLESGVARVLERPRTRSPRSPAHDGVGGR